MKHRHAAFHGLNQRDNTVQVSRVPRFASFQAVATAAPENQWSEANQYAKKGSDTTGQMQASGQWEASQQGSGAGAGTGAGTAAGNGAGTGSGSGSGYSSQQGSQSNSYAGEGSYQQGSWNSQNSQTGQGQASQKDSTQGSQQGSQNTQQNWQQSSQQNSQNSPSQQSSQQSSGQSSQNAKEGPQYGQAYPAEEKASSTQNQGQAQAQVEPEAPAQQGQQAAGSQQGSSQGWSQQNAAPAQGNAGGNTGSNDGFWHPDQYSNGNSNNNQGQVAYTPNPLPLPTATTDPASTATASQTTDPTHSSTSTSDSSLQLESHSKPDHAPNYATAAAVLSVAAVVALIAGFIIYWLRKQKQRQLAAIGKKPVLEKIPRRPRAAGYRRSMVRTGASMVGSGLNNAALSVAGVIDMIGKKRRAPASYPTDFLAPSTDDFYAHAWQDHVSRENQSKMSLTHEFLPKPQGLSRSNCSTPTLVISPANSLRREQGTIQQVPSGRGVRMEQTGAAEPSTSCVSVATEPSPTSEHNNQLQHVQQVQQQMQQQQNIQPPQEPNQVMRQPQRNLSQLSHSTKVDYRPVSPRPSSPQPQRPASPNAPNPNAPSRYGSLLAITSIVPSTTQAYRVDMDFNPKKYGQLELREGQSVKIQQAFDDGWVLCTVNETNVEGLAPRACLSPWPLKRSQASSSAGDEESRPDSPTSPATPRFYSHLFSSNNGW